jgi:hypothetical protein
LRGAIRGFGEQANRHDGKRDVKVQVNGRRRLWGSAARLSEPFAVPSGHPASSTMGTQFEVGDKDGAWTDRTWTGGVGFCERSCQRRFSSSMPNANCTIAAAVRSCRSRKKVRRDGRTLPRWIPTGKTYSSYDDDGRLANEKAGRHRLGLCLDCRRLCSRQLVRGCRSCRDKGKGSTPRSRSRMGAAVIRQTSI